MPDPRTYSPAAGPWLIRCEGRPNLSRQHSNRQEADAEALALANAYPNHRFDVFELVGSHCRRTGHRTQTPRRPPGTIDL